MSDIKVLGVGLGRTGTLSMKVALEELGFTPCHHMRDTISDPTDRNNLLTTLLHNKEDEAALSAYFAGYRAAVDQPGNMFYRQLMKMNPSLKLILTVRDTPELWERSVKETIFSGNNASGLSRWLDYLLRALFQPEAVTTTHKIIEKTLGVNPTDHKTDLIQMYNDWNDMIKETVPSGRLLVFNVKQGWRPLCEFLQVPVPDRPFPRLNNTAEWKANVAKYVTVKFLAPAVAVAGAVLYMLYAAANI
ncbi:hypothetical protein ACHWQZ_G018739 [Mnemiopsis leidyi]